jgi:dephospho-CoA kinase
MIILGLTGSIAMGKSTVAAMFRAEHVPVFDADATVHRLMAPGGAAVSPVARVFPGSLKDGAIDRKALGSLVFAHTSKRKVLEGILHPLVARERARFLGAMRRQGRPLVVLDIPLLFEAGRARLCDAVAVVSAPRRQQRHRLHHHRGMTAARVRAILAAQMPDAHKRRKADIVIHTGVSLWATRRQVRQIISRLKTEA